MRSQAEKGRLFKERHARPGILILPNPWDAGTAKLLQSLGFEALATTSLGMSNALGRADGEGAVSRAELPENCRVIARGDRAAGQCRPRERLCRRSDGSGHHPARRGGGRHRRRLRSRIGAARGSTTSTMRWRGSLPASRWHARYRSPCRLRRPRPKSDPRSARPRRYDQAPAGLREGRRRRALRARAARSGHHAHGRAGRSASR